MISRPKGFTIIELLIIIVVIAILSSIGITMYNGHRMRASVNVVIADLAQIEEALQLYVDRHQLDQWPEDDAIVDGVNSITIQQFIDSMDIKDFMPYSPSNNTPANLIWEYDNDGDAKTGCGDGTNSLGTNIAVVNLPQDLTQILDNTIDDGDLNCGKVRYSDLGEAKMYYTLSDDSTIH